MSEIKLTADSGGGTTSIKAPSSTTSNADVVLKLPVADGSSGQVLKTDGSGQLSFGSDISDLVNDTSPQLGGDLDTNSFEISLDDLHAVKFGDSADLSIFHQSGFNQIQSNNTSPIQLRDSSNVMLRADPGGAVDLRYNGSAKLATTSTGVTVSGSIDVNDNCKLLLGDGDDLQIDHSGTNSQIYHNGTGNLYIATLGTGEDIHHQSTGKMTFSTGGSERLRITDDGIKFNGDTAAANALDDYEEGTFTPDWNGGSSAGTTTYSTNNGSYTKIGNMVHIRIYSGINGTSGTGAWRVTNLPFSSPNSISHITTGSCMTDGLNFENNYTWVVPYKNSNSNDLDLYASKDNDGWDFVSIGDDSSFAIILGITYCAA